eukprot:147923-Rhodomonas_salina.1
MISWITGFIARPHLEEHQLLEEERERHCKSMPSGIVLDLRRVTDIANILLELPEGTSKFPNFPANDVALNSIRDEEHVVWAVVDSGANRHYFATEELMTDLYNVASTVHGVGSISVQTKSRGRAQGILDGSSGQSYTFSGEGTHIQGSTVNLFSVPAAWRSGHSVLFESTAHGGRCGMYINGGKGETDWVPFVYYPVTGMWYIQIRKNPMVEYGTWAASSSTTGQGY